MNAPLNRIEELRLHSYMRELKNIRDDEPVTTDDAEVYCFVLTVVMVLSLCVSLVWG